MSIITETSKLSDSSLTYTTTDLISGSRYEYSVYVVLTGTILIEENCNGYWLIDESFTNEGSLSVISTLTIDDASTNEQSYILTFTFY